VPAAAVIPAPRAYINVVAVKKPVVGFESKACGGYFVCVSSASSAFGLVAQVGCVGGSIDITYGLWSETCGIVHWFSDTFICV